MRDCSRSCRYRLHLSEWRSQAKPGGSVAEETGKQDAVASAAGVDPTATALALGGASREEADAFLRRQSRFADLQIENLQKQDEFELSHLRFRRFSDYGKFVLELSAGLVVLLLVCGLATMVWSATQDRDLVVDAFTVPPDVAQSGLTGAVLASRVLDRLGTMEANTFSLSQSAGSNRGEV